MRADAGRTGAAAVPHAAAATMVGCGVVLGLVGAQVLGLLGVVALATDLRPADLYEAWVAAAAAVAAGWVLATAGTARLGVAMRCLRRATPATWTALVLAATTTIVLVPVIMRAAGSTGRTASIVAVVLQGALLAAFHRWSRSTAAAPLPAPSPRTLANLLIVGFLVATAVTAVAALRDVYPISRFPMYSGTRPDPYTEARVRVVGVERDGSERDLPLPASKNVLVGMAEADEVGALRELAAEVARSRSVAAVRVVYEEIQVSPHPAPPGVEVVATKEVVRVAHR